MIVELVTFKAPEGASWQSILADAKSTIPRWRANDKLVRKHYLVSDDGRSVRASTFGRHGPRRSKRTTRNGAPAFSSAQALRPRSPISIS